jgi:O-antigen ligase
MILKQKFDVLSFLRENSISIGMITLWIVMYFLFIVESLNSGDAWRAISFAVTGAMYIASMAAFLSRRSTMVKVMILHIVTFGVATFVFGEISALWFTFAVNCMIVTFLTNKQAVAENRKKKGE